jgi:hypothetical protein
MHRKTPSPRCCPQWNPRARSALAALEINIYNSLASVELTAGPPADAERYLAKGVELATAQGNKNLPHEARAQPDAGRAKAR